MAPRIPLLPLTIPSLPKGDAKSPVIPGAPSQLPRLLPHLFADAFQAVSGDKKNSK